MPDGDVTFQGVEGLLIENLGDKTQVLVHHNLISIANGDAGFNAYAVSSRPVHCGDGAGSGS